MVQTPARWGLSAFIHKDVFINRSVRRDRRGHDY